MIGIWEFFDLVSSWQWLLFFLVRTRGASGVFTDPVVILKVFLNKIIFFLKINILNILDDIKYPYIKNNFLKIKKLF